jgi:hypothetical protein
LEEKLPFVEIIEDPCHNPHQRHPQNGAQQKAYKNTDIALTIPSGYQGNQKGILAQNYIQLQ